MGSTNTLNALIKQSAMEAMNQSKPLELVFGTVTGSSPLQIKVEEKITLTTAQLILCRNVTTHKVSMTMDWSSESALSDHTHSVSGNTQSAGDLPHTHGISVTTGATTLTHSHSVTGTKDITINNALTVGESVVLVRMQGGQKYLVLDRVVSA